MEGGSVTDSRVLFEKIPFLFQKPQKQVALLLLFQLIEYRILKLIILNFKQTKQSSSRQMLSFSIEKSGKDW